MDVSESHGDASAATTSDCLTLFAHSALFERLFDEGMALVETATEWLEGPGRGLSRSLPREQALYYASLSLDLTTRLMQVSAWLVAHRAIREGAGADAAHDPLYRLPTRKPAPEAATAAIHPDFVSLHMAVHRFHRRVARIDALLHRGGQEAAAGGTLDVLRRAFPGG